MRLTDYNSGMIPAIYVTKITLIIQTHADNNETHVYTKIFLLLLFLKWYKNNLLIITENLKKI